MPLAAAVWLEGRSFLNWGPSLGEENCMKCTRFALFAALTVIVPCCRQATAQNLLTDPSFENPALYTADGPPFIGSWEAFNGGTGSSSQNDALAPHSGAR